MKKMLCLILILLLIPISLPLAESFPAVAVSFLPISIFAENILDGSGSEPIILAPSANGCLHDYQLLPGDLSRLESADLLFVNGAGMESFLSDIQAVYPSLAVIDLSEGIELLPDENDAAQVNSHIWLSPKNAMIMVSNMAQALAEADGAHSDLYLSNAEAYISRLKALDDELLTRSQGLTRRDIITFHEAFPYFARDYDLNVLAVIALEPDEGISPKRLAYLTDLIRKNNNPPLFIEAQYPSDAAEALAHETGAEIYELDTVTSGSSNADAYEQALRRNMDTLEKALGPHQP